MVSMVAPNSKFINISIRYANNQPISGSISMVIPTV